MKNFLLYWVLLITVSISACGKKNIAAKKKLNEEFKVAELDFDYLTSRGKITYKDPTQEVSSSVDIRMKKDSIIWMSIKPMLGIEAARLVITKDSVMMIDRLNKTMVLLSFDSLNRKVNFPLDLKIVEALIIGNLPVKVDNKRTKIAMESEHFKLRQRQGDFDMVSLVSREHYKLERIDVEQDNTSNELILKYEDFKVVREQIVPFISTAILNYKDKVTKVGNQIEVNVFHNKIDLPKEPLTFPFQKLNNLRGN
jgi:hypothetical protein